MFLNWYIYIGPYTQNAVDWKMQQFQGRFVIQSILIIQIFDIVSISGKSNCNPQLLTRNHQFHQKIPLL